MSDSENDSSIRVNIRTGTSTRRPQIRPQSRQDHFRQLLQQFEGKEPSRVNPHANSRMRTRIQSNGLPQYLYMQELLAYLQNNVLDNEFNHTLISSMNDSDLVRHPSVQLDIEKHFCRSSEISQPCGICQDNFSIEEELSTLEECSHTFHYNCIDEWGKYKPECPLCRTQIKTLD